jgi:hypothetical protein
MVELKVRPLSSRRNRIVFLVATASLLIVGVAEASVGVYISTQFVHVPRGIWIASFIQIIHASLILLAFLKKRISPKWYFPLSVTVCILQLYSCCMIGSDISQLKGMHASATVKADSEPLFQVMRSAVGDLLNDCDGFRCENDALSSKLEEWADERTDKWVDVCVFMKKSETFCKLFEGLLMEYLSVYSLALSICIFSTILTVFQTSLSAYIILSKP